MPFTNSNRAVSSLFDLTVVLRSNLTLNSSRGLSCYQNVLLAWVKGQHHRITDITAGDEPRPVRNAPKKGQPLQTVDVNTSKAYMKSSAFETTYGKLPIWHHTLYRRNFKGHYDPVMTRPSCIQRGVYISSNPCPVCRDSHLNIHHDNVDLLKHFIEPQTGEVVSFRKTNICQRQHKRLVMAVGRAFDRGLLETRLPKRDYDYRHYYGAELLEEYGYEERISKEEAAFLARTRTVADRQLGRNDTETVFDGDESEAEDEDDDLD